MADAACNICAKTASDDITLKRCAKCKTQWYCSRECQKADWKNHKKVCSQNAAGATSTPLPPPKNLSVRIEKPFHKLNNKIWLHNRPEKDVYKLLIDAYRLRMEDQYTFECDPGTDCIYGGAPDSRVGFRRFLRLAERKPGLLPRWWSAEKSAECVAMGLREDDGDDWSSLACAVEKGDIIEHYGDPFMPMQLRIFAEQMYGEGPGGQSGASMLSLMMAQESGAMSAARLDVSTLFGRR